MYYYLAFDQASGTTGYSIFTDDGLVKYGKFSTKGHDFLEKVTETCDFIEGIVKEFQERGKVEVHLEDIQLQANAKTYKQLAQLQGAISDRLRNKLNVEIEDFTLASVWKSTSNVRGKNRTEQKRNAQRIVLEEFGVAVTQDEADAILLGKHVSSQGFNWA